MVNIDAKDLILGRIATFAAKRALEGENVNILNAEKAVVTGKKKAIFAKYKKRRDIGSTEKGPFFPRKPDRLVKRAIRGMLPYKKDRGRKALKKIKVYLGIPEKFKNQKLETIEKANIKKIKIPKYVKIEELSKWLGSKW